jgi:hypothetical protein
METEETATKNVANRMFDLAEKCVMEYMCAHYKISPEMLFVDPSALSGKTIPLLINPIKTYSDNIISLTIDIVPYGYVSNIPAVLKENETIVNMIGFIYHSINTVFNTIINTNIKESFTDEVFNASVHLEMDDNAIAMYPIYIFPERRRKLVFLQIRDDIDNTMNKLKASSIDNSIKITDFTKQYEQLTADINDIKYDIECADKVEMQVNEDLKKNNRIGIIFKEIPIDTLNEYCNTL